MLKPAQVKRLKEEVEFCKRPLIFFDGDNDGLTSFLQLYRFKGDGKGVILKTKPRITESHLRRIAEYAPDKIFIFDIAEVDPEFIRKAGVPILWFDHHGPFEPDEQKAQYINPLLWGENTSPCVMIYQLCEKDMWISAAGAITDHQFPYFWKDFVKRYPHLVKSDLKRFKEPFDVRFTTPLGTLIKVFAFNLKGSTTEAMKAIKVMTRIEDPMDILEQRTPKGRFLYRRYQKLEKDYQDLLKKALKKRSDDPFLIFEYTEKKTSFTRELADELMWRNPDKVTILARERQGYMVMSMRTHQTGPEIKPAVEKALQGVDGSGGGHAHACGAKVAKVDFPLFLKTLREEIGESKKK